LCWALSSLPQELILLDAGLPEDGSQRALGRVASLVPARARTCSAIARMLAAWSSGVPMDRLLYELPTRCRTNDETSRMAFA